MVDGADIPGAPFDYLQKPVVIEFEEGPPDTPDFCLDLARRHLSSSKASPEDRAKEAFRAGFWARAVWTCHTEHSSTYKPLVAGSTQWVLRKGVGFDLVRVATQADCEKLILNYQDVVLLDKLPSLTELHIYCAGASVPVPPLWRWKSNP